MCLIRISNVANSRILDKKQGVNYTAVNLSRSIPFSNFLRDWSTGKQK